MYSLKEHTQIATCINTPRNHFPQSVYLNAQRPSQPPFTSYAVSKPCLY